MTGRLGAFHGEPYQLRQRAQIRSGWNSGQAAAAPLLAASGLGPALMPASIIPPHFDGQVLRPDPAVRRPLAACTRTRADPLTTAFTEMLTRTKLVMPQHVRERLRPPPGDENGQTGPR
jgi:DNA-binding transcriptional LysR family regulator